MQNRLSFQMQFKFLKSIRSTSSGDISTGARDPSKVSRRYQTVADDSLLLP